jgi:hypothetical protein
MKLSRLARFTTPLAAILLTLFAFAPTAVHAASLSAQAEEPTSGVGIVLALLALILLLVAVVGVIGAVALGIIGIGYSTVTPDDE